MDKHWGNQRVNNRDTLKSQWDRLDLDPRFDYEKGIIDSFYGKYRFLSNYYPSEITYNGKLYPTTEHAYQAAKTLDPKWQEAIRIAEGPHKAKQKGQLAPIRDDWEVFKYQVMREILKLKFEDTNLYYLLLETHPMYLVEGVSWHDNVWGICLLADCPRCSETRGENALGVMLMELREEILIKRLGEEVQAAKDHYEG